MRNRFLACCLAAVFALTFPAAAWADVPTTKKYINIATVDNRSITIDRLLYTAFRDMDYEASFETGALQSGYNLADNGEIDGVISSLPNMEELYPNLRKVPFTFDYTSPTVLIRNDSGIKISRWTDLDGYSVGILANTLYSFPDGAVITEKDSTREVLDGLSAGEYDAAVLSRRLGESLETLPDNVKNLGAFETFREFLYLHSDYEHLIPELVDALNVVFSDGRADDILNSYPMPWLNNKKTILHINSSSTEVEREGMFSTALKSAFSGDESIEWYSVELNSKRFSGDPNRLIYFARLLRRDSVSRNISAIVVSGEEALDFVKTYYSLLFRNVPVLFYGVGEDQLTRLGDNAAYFTGIVEQLPVFETVSAALALFPDTQELFVVNDYTPEGRQYHAAAEEQLAELSDRLNIGYSANTSREELLAQIRELPKNSLVFVGSYFCDANGQYFSLNDMKMTLREQCDVPIFALYSTEADYNAVGGKCLDYTKYGEAVADMLERLLDGEDVEAVAVDYGDYTRWVFDKLEMDRFGVKDNALPAHAVIINRTPYIWETDPLLVAVAIAFLVVCIIVMILMYIFMLKFRRQNANLIETQKHLHTAEEILAKDEKIKEVKERLELIINTAPVSYVMSGGGLVLETNENIRQTTGIQVGDHINKIHADEMQDFDYIVDRLEYTDTIKNEVMRIRQATGELRRMLVNIATIEYEQQKAAISWMVDIEDEETKKDLLEIARRSLQAILDTMPAPICIVDSETGDIVYGNNIFLNMFEFDSPEHLRQQRITDLLVWNTDGSPEELAERLIRSEEPLTVELNIRTSMDHAIDIRLLTRPIDYEGRRSSIGIMTDLTAEKEYQRMLVNTAEKEKEANQLKSRFLVNMSHEIRTPMNAIIGLTEIELRKNPTKETQEVYKKILTSAKNLLQIINDILDLSKIEADKIELFNDEFELEDTINSALLVASPRLDGKNVEFMLDAALDLPRYVIGDKTRLWQVLKNFLDNSAKYTEKGKIVLTVSVDNERSDDGTVYITFVISDTGIGMAEEQLSRIFLPYEQLYSHIQRTYAGTGLGMPISKQLCELMGGTLNIESKAGVGTTITINIPFGRSNNTVTELESLKTPELADLKILIVDDDEFSLDIMQTLLECNNVYCVRARSGYEAMEVIFEHRDRGIAFDMILLDYKMEGLSGLETARQIQSGLSHAPKLLMVTAYQKQLIKGECDSSGIDGILEKPFIPTEFIHKLRQTIGREESPAEEEDTFTQFEGANVLLCEDYRLNQEVAVGMFAQFGIDPVIAENGKEGVDILNSGQAFDLIFMDLQMPVMNGYEATEIIRADSRFDNVPIVSLTADAMVEVVNRCMEMGMNDHLPKPIDFDGLHNIFLKWLPESKRVAGKAKRPERDPLNDALARFGGRADLYEKALAEFARELPDEWPEFDRAAGNEFMRDIHKYKGAAGNLALDELYRYCAEFESSLRNNAPDRDVYKHLTDASAIFKKAVAEQEPVAAAEDGTAEELGGHLSRLREALLDYDPLASSEIIGQMKEKLWPVDEAKLNELYGLADSYDFDSALEVLEGIEK